MRNFLLLISLFFYSGAYTQDKSNKGKEFWLGYGNNVLFDHEVPVNNQNLVLYLSADEATQVTVTVNGTSWSRVINIPAGTVDFSVVLPKTGAEDCRIISEGVFTRGIHIVSQKPIVAYAHQFSTQLSGATMLMPVETYGYTYYSINSNVPYTGATPPKNWFFVIASEDNTTVQITPSDTTEGERLPNQPFTVTLNKGELYNVFGKVTDNITKDLTGSKVVSVTGSDGNCHPVALFSGCSRFLVCATDGGEVSQQQIFPASAWGTSYLSYHSFSTINNPFNTPFLNFYRVVVADPLTIVKRNGVVLTGLQKNSFYEFQGTSGDFIEADMPVMVSQYTPNSNHCTGTSLSPQGDPEMFFLSPLEQGIKKAIVYHTRNNNITVCYLTIIIPNNGVNSLKIDGAAVSAAQHITHPANNNYQVVAKRLLGPAAQHTITSDSAFNAFIYGTGVFESYGYIAGTLVNNLNSIGSIKNVYNTLATPDSYTCPQSPLRFTVQLAYKATSIQWRLSQVTSVLPARDTTQVNPQPIDSQIINGRKYYTYTLENAYRFSDTGTFAIPIVYASPGIDNCSKVENSAITVLVKPGPVADFSTTYAGCSKDTAFFTATPDAGTFNISKYAWYQDDSSIDSTQSIQKVFLPGPHHVTQRIIATNGCVDDTTKIINTYGQPVATFGYERNICLGDSIHFTDSSTLADGPIKSWQWSFGDGSSSLHLMPATFFHTYMDVGNYPVSLTVNSGKGCVSEPFTLAVTVKKRPAAYFSIAGKACVDSSLFFTPMVISNENLVKTGYWDFGDGNTSAQAEIAVAQHAYAIAFNNVVVKYVVSAGEGCSSDTATQISALVNENPIAKFGFEATGFCPLKEVLFRDRSSGSIQDWSWNFGDGSLATSTNIQHIFNKEGTYHVRLIVQNSAGCQSTAFVMPVTIYPLPDIDAGPTLFKIKDQATQIKASISNASMYKYAWLPADFLNSPDSLLPVTNTTSDILYTVKAYGGPGNCEATDTVSVRILKQLFIPNAFSPNGDGLNDLWNLPSINGNPKATVIIYNRWGKKIFESKGYNSPWDGTYAGQSQPAGAYYYIIRTDVAGDKKITGSVIIVR